MEASPLTLAYSHARNSISETKRSNPLAASEEHELAAAEFATAAQGSGDTEAIRILNLLGQHHKRLGQILKAEHEKPVAEEQNETKVVGSTAKPPRLSRTVRESTRDLSSSIASNLATARGIPGGTRQKRSTPISPLVSNQHADGQLSNEVATSRNPSQAPATTGRPSWTPPVNTTEDTPETSEGVDSPFQLFYNTFEGLISKMSAPLAFAGLPLAQPVVEEKQAAPAKPPSQASKPEPTSRDHGMDYSRLISNAAFRAVSTNTTTDTPVKKLEDSFYHVPTAGGTISYAEMVNRADREEARTFRGQPHHQRQVSNLSNISEDDFVDANSTILAQAQAPRAGRRGTTTERKVDGKTMEELALENKALKHVTDTLSRRLHMFEMSSQTSTAALAQSIRSMPRSPTAMSPEQSRAVGQHTKRPQTSISNRTLTANEDEGTAKRIAELESILQRSDARVKKRDAEVEKLRVTVERYKEKWDSLKAGAKARRERQQGSAGEPSNAAGSPTPRRGSAAGGLARRESEGTVRTVGSVPEESEV